MDLEVDFQTVGDVFVRRDYFSCDQERRNANIATTYRFRKILLKLVVVLCF